MRDIVLIHGGEQGSWIWDETVAAMRTQAGSTPGRVLALDVPGCGRKRDRNTTGLAVAEVVAELAGELAAQDVRDALLVGHSQAGTLLPGLVAACPGRIARAVYFACAAPRQGQTVLQLMGTSLHGVDADAVGWPLDPATTPGPELFAAAFCNDMDEDSARAFVGRLGQDHWPSACATVSDSWAYEDAAGIPATYVVALADAILPVAWQERFAARLRADTLVRLDAGHQSMNTRPFGLAEILLAEARRPLAALANPLGEA